MAAARFSSFREAEAALPRGLARVLRTMRTTPAHRFTIGDLARIAGISRRTLQRQFQSFLDQTPLEALRQIRLEAARQILLRGSKRATVSDVALRCGFSHLGRFSAEYFGRFGEKPSETLRRVSAVDMAIAGPMFLARSGDRPAVAVLPIEKHGESEAIELAEALVTALTRAGIPVTSRLDKARYHLRGVCREAVGQVRVTLRLLDASNGRHLWAHEQEGMKSERAWLEERIALGAATALQQGLREAEIGEARHRPEADLTAHGLAMKAWPHVTALDAGRHQQAMDLLEASMNRDPDYALTIALAAWCHAQRAVYQFGSDTEEARRAAVRLALRSANLGGDSTTFAILGHALACAHELEKAGEATRRALLLDGASAWAWGRSAWLAVYSGRAEEAVEKFAISLDLAPRDPMKFNNLAGLGCAHLHMGRYAEAAHWMALAIDRHPPAVWAHRVLGPTYLLSGNRAAAQHSFGIVQKLYPGTTALECALAAPLPPASQHLVAEGLESMGMRA